MTEFRLITFNCFGVPGPVTHRRLLALAGELNASDATTVCLQEVQATPYRTLLTRACHTFPHAAYEPYIHAPKGGLLTLSRAVITHSTFTPYQERGQWYTPSLADVALAKGVLKTHKLVGGVPIVVLNTHLNANYRGDWTNENRYTRTERNQLAELAKIVNAQPPEALVIVCGDFNVPRGSSLYTEFIAATGLFDPMAEDTRPTYRPLPGLPARFALPIDFTLVRTPGLGGFHAQSDIRFSERVAFGGGTAFLSDHLALELRVSWV